MNSNKKYYYCYSSTLFKFLKIQKGINYVCTGLNENTLRKFWQFERNQELDIALNQYQKNINI